MRFCSKYISMWISSKSNILIFTFFPCIISATVNWWKQKAAKNWANIGGSVTSVYNWVNLWLFFPLVWWQLYSSPSLQIAKKAELIWGVCWLLYCPLVWWQLYLHTQSTSCKTQGRYSGFLVEVLLYRLTPIYLMLVALKDNVNFIHMNSTLGSTKSGLLTLDLV